MSDRAQQEAMEMAAQMAERDQNDADVQEIARQVGVFCRGLDEAGVKHSIVNPSEDRRQAIVAFVLTEIGRLRDKQTEEE